LACRSTVAVPVGERLLEDPVDGDLRREGAVAQVGRHRQLDGLVGQGFVLDRETLDDRAEGPPLEPWGPERPDEVPDFPERALKQTHRLPGALLRGWVWRERAHEDLELGQRREDVLDGAVVHVEHDALELTLAGREQAPRRRGTDVRIATLHRVPQQHKTRAGHGPRLRSSAARKRSPYGVSDRT